MSEQKQKSIYSPSPSFAYYQALIENTLARTGKTFEEWVAILHSDGPSDEKAQQGWLKKEYGLSVNPSSLVVATDKEGATVEDYNPETYVDKMFSGKKEPLRPLYEQLLRIGLSIGDEVKACPCETIVPLYRNHVFAQLKPTTFTRIDVGLALKNTPTPEDGLIDTGGFAKKDRITHRIPISSIDDINDTVCHWLKIAYEMDEKKSK